MNIIKSGLVLMVVAGFPFIFSSCIDSPTVADPNKQLEEDIATIDTYLTANSITAEKDPNGIRMDIHELGTGLPANFTSSLVNVKYVGKFFPGGGIFDQNSTGYETVLNSVIPGWQIAFRTLPAGSKATLYIPSYWAYGASGRGTIPPNAILTFDVEFVKAIITTAELAKLSTDTTEIDTYLTGKAIEAVKDTTGIRYVIENAGTGSAATWFDKLKVKLTYRLVTDDTKIAASVDQVPSEFFYSRVVDYPNGLKVGLQKLGIGGKATFYIPSGLGFGANGAYAGGVKVIPENANLIVEVELKDIAQ